MKHRILNTLIFSRVFHDIDISKLVSTVRAEYLLVSGLAGLSGGYVCFNIGVYAYTADVSR